MCGGIVAVDAEPIPAAVHSVNSVNESERIAKLFSDLRAAGVDARPTPEGIELKGPTAGLTVELLDRLRADRAGLLALLMRSERAVADGDATPELAGPASGRETAPSGAFHCPWCGPVELRDDPEGLRCGRCERLAWVLVDWSIIRADCVDDDLEGLAPDDVPTCPNCGRWCDAETITGRWHCSRCDAGAEERRRRVLRILDRVERVRRRG